MFENALIYRAGVEKKIDLGTMAETLFFYGKTHLLLDRSSVIALVKKIDHDVLLELFDRDIIALSYIRNSFGVLSQGLPALHDFGAFRLEGTAKGQKINNHADEIVDALEQELGKSSQTKKLATNIARRVSLHRFRGVPQKEKIVPDLTRTDIQDSEFVRRAVATTLAHIVSDFDVSTPFEFRLIQSSEGSYYVHTDLDFQKLNAAYHTVVPATHSSITTSFLLTHLLAGC
jgi:hypothetical protein